MSAFLLAKPNIEFSRIANHKYNVVGKSICEPLFHHYWEWSASLLPNWVSPNALTLCGLLANILGTLLILLSNPDFSSAVPKYFTFFYACCVFAYQTLDAIDGKHARKTNTCSQLGELFDHGCDAISMVTLPLGYFGIIGIGTYPVIMFIEYFSICVTFYKYQWQTYMTGVFEFDIVCVTETLVLLMAVALISTFAGVEFWCNKDPIFGVELKIHLFIIVFIASLVFFVQLIRIVFQGGIGKFGTTIANTSVLSPIVPMTLVIGSAIWVAVRSPSNLYQSSPAIFLATFGAIFAKISVNLEVAYMTRTSVPIGDVSLLAPACLIINQMFDCIINERFLLWLSCIYCLVVLFYYCGYLAVNLADFLGINVLRMGPRVATSARSKQLARPAMRRQVANSVVSSRDTPGVRTRGMTTK